MMDSKKFVLMMLAGLAVLVVAVVGTMKHRSDREELTERGRYLVELGGCNLCHTPKIMTSAGMELDQSRLLSGHPADADISDYTAEALNEEGEVTRSNFHLTQWSGPWGVSFAANLTPDSMTGIGSWTVDTFIKTIRTGRHMGSGRRIQLPMPTGIFAHFSDEDLAAIFAYLQSLKPVENKVPPPIPTPDNVEPASGE